MGVGLLMAVLKVIPAACLLWVTSEFWPQGQVTLRLMLVMGDVATEEAQRVDAPAAGDFWASPGLRPQGKRVLRRMGIMGDEPRLAAQQVMSGRHR